jgi:folate-binding protein YgfZ
MGSDEIIFDLVRTAREHGLLAPLARSQGQGFGMAVPGAILARGPDAAEFLHSQVTNEVHELEIGEGNFSARVMRTGQLLQFFSLHRLPDDGDAQNFLLILERASIGELVDAFDSFLFADQLTLQDVSEHYRWTSLHGPKAAEVAEAALPDAALNWSELSSFAIRPLSGAAAPGALVIHRSLTGDAGLLFALPSEAEDEALQVDERLTRAARDAEVSELHEPELSQVLDILRIEAGQLRVGPDTQSLSPRKPRILPETGLEQLAVSYTKGCYLGQEVIARVRTYGALPYGLRGLIFHEAEDADLDARRKLLARIPDVGEKIVSEGGKRIGQLVSRTISPTLERVVAFAYLDKTHRTPGSILELALEDGVLQADVVLLPFYNAPNRDERVLHLYDRAIRIFAQGREEAALQLLEEALALDPGFSDGYEAIGVILGRSERFHEAIDIFKRLEELSPEIAMVNTNLSLYYMKIGDKTSAESEAAKAMQKGLAATTGPIEQTQAVEHEMAEARRQDALRKKNMFGQVLEIDAEDPVALFGLGNALATLEEWEQAAEIYAEAAAADATNSAVHLARGKALQELGKMKEAEAVFREGMEVASRKGDLMPLKEMEHRVLLLSGVSHDEAPEESTTQ